MVSVTSLFSNSPFFSNAQRRHMQLGLLGFSLGKRERLFQLAAASFGGKERSPLFPL